MTEFIEYSSPATMVVVKTASGTIPKYAHKSDAGMDLVASVGDIITNGAVSVVNTGIRVAIPEGHVGLVCPRSGLAVKGVTVVNAPGIIDSGYRGPLKVLLTNLTPNDVEIQPGDRIAQLVIIPIIQPRVLVVDKFEEETDRGVHGFGSTGR